MVSLKTLHRNNNKVKKFNVRGFFSADRYVVRLLLKRYKYIIYPSTYALCKSGKDQWQPGNPYRELR